LAEHIALSQRNAVAPDRPATQTATFAGARSFGRGLLALGSVAFVLAHGAAARADEPGKAECAAAYEQGQEDRSEGKLGAAQSRFVVCAQATCPSFIQSDCTVWLDELHTAMPTVVIAARDPNGNDALNVKVTLDGTLVLSVLDGKPLAVDPGQHKFRFELAGAEPVEEQVVVEQGEKDRVVRVSFDSVGLGAAIANPYAQPTAPKTRTKGSARLRLYSYVAGGVAGAGVVGFAVLGLVGKSEESHLDDLRCAPHCSQGDVDAIRTKYVVADVSLGVGLAALAAGVTLFVLSEPKHGDKPPAATNPSSATTFDVHTTPGGAFATVAGHF
jgi:hypothetical protein